MEFETGRRSTLARLQLSVQGLAGSLNSAKKVLVASTVLTAAFCGAVFGLTLVANEASKESHISEGVIIDNDGETVAVNANKGWTSLAEMPSSEIAKMDFVSFSQDGADRYMQILDVQSTASKKVINTIVGAFEVTEEGMTFAGDNVVLESTEADKAARKAQCNICGNGRNTQCRLCINGRSTFAAVGRNPFCAICNNRAGRNFQCHICKNGGRNAQCRLCANAGRSNQCRVCGNGRGAQCGICHNRGRNFLCAICGNGLGAQQVSAVDGGESAFACEGSPVLAYSSVMGGEDWGDNDFPADSGNLGRFDGPLVCDSADGTAACWG